MNKIPSAVKSFLIKGLIIFVAWKLLYLLLLTPSRILDKPLTDFTAIGAAKTLNFLSHSSDYTTLAEIDEYDADGVRQLQPLMSIYFHGEKQLSVADACNALELFVLYAGFIICFPSALKRKILFIVGGIILICLINILRCAGLAWIFIYYPQYGDFSHHYVFTFIVYVCIFLLWFWFSKKTNADVKT
ncbi:MAG: archaeosortase/exosortase family protein [Parafilimonas sp.]